MPPNFARPDGDGLAPARQRLRKRALVEQARAVGVVEEFSHVIRRASAGVAWPERPIDRIRRREHARLQVVGRRDDVGEPLTMASQPARDDVSRARPMACRGDRV